MESSSVEIFYIQSDLLEQSFLILSHSGQEGWTKKSLKDLSNLRDFFGGPMKLKHDHYKNQNFTEFYIKQCQIIPFEHKIRNS